MYKSRLSDTTSGSTFDGFQSVVGLYEETHIASGLMTANFAFEPMPAGEREGSGGSGGYNAGFGFGAAVLALAGSVKGVCAMLFSEKLKAIKRLLQATNVELARAAGVDASCICRCANGSYVPSKNSRIVNRIADGTAKLTDKKKTAELRSLCGGEESQSTRDALLAWFNAEDSGLKKERGAKRKSAAGREGKKAESARLSQRLAFLMDTLEISNASLARYVNVDSSTISRYRTGKRSLRTQESLLREFCRYFAVVCRSRRDNDRLLSALKLGKEELRDEASAELKFFEWLRRDDASHLASTHDFLAGVATAGKEKAEGEARARAKRSGVTVTEEMFCGAEGVTEALARFSECAASEKGRVCLYAADSSWFGHDERLTREWSALLAGIIAAGGRIKVIHSLSSDVDLTFRAIAPWLPLYLTGGVEPFYLTRPNRSLLSEYIGAANGLCTLRFARVREDGEAPAFFSCSAQKASALKMQFDSLLSYAKPLLKSYRAEDYKALSDDMEKHLRADGDLVKFMPLLSLESMPERLAAKIFSAHGISGGERASFDRYYARRRKSFLASLSEVNVTEVYPLYPQSLIDGGGVKLRHPWLMESGDFHYSPDEYREHLAAQETLEREHANYRRVFLADFPFMEMDIFAKQGQAVYIIRNDTPLSAFSFLNSHISYVLEKYLERFIS